MGVAVAVKSMALRLSRRHCAARTRTQSAGLGERRRHAGSAARLRVAVGAEEDLAALRQLEQRPLRELLRVGHAVPRDRAAEVRSRMGALFRMDMATLKRAAAGDLGPEGILFIPADKAPGDTPLLVVCNEISGTTSVFSIREQIRTTTHTQSESTLTGF